MFSSNRYDSAGPMGKSTWDLAVLLGCMIGQPGVYDDFISEVNSDLAQFRLGVPRLHFNAYEDSNAGPPYDQAAKAEAIEIFDEVVRKLASGVALDPADFLSIKGLWTEMDSESSVVEGDVSRCAPLRTIMDVEYYNALNDYLRTRGNDEVHDLASLVEWNAKHPVSSDSSRITHHQDKAYHGEAYEHQDDTL